MVDLIIMGDDSQLLSHRKALIDLPDINLISSVDCPNPLDHKLVDGLVLLDVKDKSYWAAAAMEAGIPVMAPHPILTNFHDNENLSRADRLPPILCIKSLGQYTLLSQALLDLQANALPTSYFVIELDIDSKQSNYNRDAFLSQAILALSDLLISVWGPVDTLYSRMRNFFHSGPIEDVTVVLLRFRNGVEGLLKLIDLPIPKPILRVRSYAGDSSIDGVWDWEFAAVDHRTYYRNFADCIHGEAQPLLGLDKVGESYRLLNWMRKSARSDAVLNRKDSR